MVQPEDFLRRIPAYRTHRQLGAAFRAAHGVAFVDHYSNPDREAEQARRLALADLCALPRCGFKGAGSVEWLTSQGIAIPSEMNRAERQSDGGLVARLGNTDIMILSDVTARSDRPFCLIEEWPKAEASPKGFDAYREYGFAWFLLVGEYAPELFSRISSVDLRFENFAEMSVAQTNVLGLGGVIIRADVVDIPGYHLLFDIASSEYFIEGMLETMEEFDGGVIGLAGLEAMLD